MVLWSNLFIFWWYSVVFWMVYISLGLLGLHKCECIKMGKKYPVKLKHCEKCLLNEKKKKKGFILVALIFATFLHQDWSQCKYFSTNVYFHWLNTNPGTIGEVMLLFILLWSYYYYHHHHLLYCYILESSVRMYSFRCVYSDT